MTDLQTCIGSYFGASQQEIEQITDYFIETDLKKGAHFIRAGQFCDKLSFVQEGFIRVFNLQGHKEITQWITTKGYFITDLNSFIFDQRARWNMQALSDCRLYTVHKENYEKLKREVPGWNEMEKRFIAGCFVTLGDRVFTHLSLSAEKRYELLFESQPALFNHVPMQYLASMLGMTPETFSRIRSRKLS